MKKLMYILLSTEQYEVLNEQISEAMGFDVGLPTERYAPVTPMLAKVNIQFSGEGENVVETFDTIPVMPITATVQDLYPNLLVGYELIESYTPYVDEDVQLGAELNQIDNPDSPLKTQVTLRPAEYNVTNVLISTFVT